jgi:cysteinyl-tRNA synthetase
MQLFNTLTYKKENFEALNPDKITMYSCGPTVYGHAHIGNLRSFITADILRRTLQIEQPVEHVMNITDVDDKMINRSQETYPDYSPEEALRLLASTYEKVFLSDMTAIGNDVAMLNIVRATQSIEAMQTLIAKLLAAGFAYIADDGVYFSITAYRKHGKKYGQLLELQAASLSESRINNDEYDKDSIHDFALWKTKKDNEPAWEFELDGHSLLGRPGWHIECSAMSTTALGQPFDIHTGGIDLIFPHHENEIAQSTATEKSDTYASFFVHNEHLLVDGKKMSKSLNNFFTLQDIQERGFDPLAFRVMVLQAHYRNQLNFTWESLEAAQNRLNNFSAMADLQRQASDSASEQPHCEVVAKNIITALQDDLNTPEAMVELSKLASQLETNGLHTSQHKAFIALLHALDNVFGLDLAKRPDITNEQKDLLDERQKARDSKDWGRSDAIRDELAKQSIIIRDTDHGQIWSRTS